MMNRYFLNTLVFVFLCLAANYLRSSEAEDVGIVPTKPASADTRDAKVDELSKKMQQAFLQKDYDDAVKYLGQIYPLYNPETETYQVLTTISILAGIYHLKGKEELVLPIWEAIPFESKIYHTDIYFDYGNLLHRNGKFKKSENFFSREIVLIGNKIKEYKNKTNQNVVELNILHFNLGVCFYHRIISRLIQNKKLTPELKYMIQDDIKNCVAEIKQINSPFVVREPLSDIRRDCGRLLDSISRNCGRLLDVMVKADPQQIFLAPKKPQPPIITVGKTAEDKWNVNIVFAFEFVALGK